MEQLEAGRSVASRVRRRLTYANVAATLALVMASGGTAVAAVMISSNSQVGSNTISGHAAPSGKHANVISGSINTSDLNGSVKTAFTDHCPSGMQLAGGLCIELNDRKPTPFDGAATTCANLGRRLPDFGELTEVLSTSGAPSVDYWSSNLVYDDGFDAVAVGQDASRTPEYDIAPPTVANFYRCVSTPTD